MLLLLEHAARLRLGRARDAWPGTPARTRWRRRGRGRPSCAARSRRRRGRCRSGPGARAASADAAARPGRTAGTRSPNAPVPRDRCARCSAACETTIRSSPPPRGWSARPSRAKPYQSCVKVPATPQRATGMRSSAGTGCPRRNALGERRAVAAQVLELLRLLDALDDRGRPERRAEHEHGGDDRRRARVVRHALEEAAVDLEHLDGQVAEASERGVAGAEVVDGEGQAGVGEVRERGAVRALVAEDRALRQLGAEAVGLEVVALDALEDRLDEIGTPQLARRDVERRAAARSPARATARRARTGPRGPSPRCRR